MFRWIKRIAFAAVTVALFTMTTSAQSFGPFDPYIIPPHDPGAFKIITPAELDESFRRIRSIIRDLGDEKNEKERKIGMTSILRLCQAELNKEHNAVGVIKEDEDLWIGAYVAVELQILALGDDGLKLYEQEFGSRAQTQMDDARANHDREAMLDVNRRYGLTRAGVSAAVLLAQWWWEEGETSLAARAIERALTVRALLTDDAQANLIAWLAACYRDLGERAHLSQLIDNNARLFDKEVTTGGGTFKLSVLLKSELARARDSTNDVIDTLGVSWPGGNYTNTGIPPAPTDLDRVGWSRRLPRMDSPTAAPFMDYPYPMVPPFLPVCDGLMAYVNTGEALVAYDAFTGSRENEPAWRVRAFPPDLEHHRRFASDSDRGPSAADPNLTLPVSVYKGTVFAALENPLNKQFHQFTPDGMFALYSHYPQVRRALCAVNGDSGRLLWRIGGMYEGDDTETTNFLSAVVHQGTLYAIGSRMPSQAEIFLYALNPDTGAVLWKLRLCYGQQEVTMFGRPSRQPYPSLPAISGGQLYVCTNIGGVVAVDLSRRCLAWIGRYEYMSRPITRSVRTYYRQVTWYNSPTFYAEYKGRGYVVCAGTDSRDLVAFDAGTGERLWQLSRGSSQEDDEDQDGPLAAGRAVVGIRGGIVYVAGDDELFLVSLDGGTLKKKVLPASSGDGRSLGNTLVGRPCLTGDKLLWPGRNGISEIDLTTFKTVAVDPAPSLSRIGGLSVFVQQGLTFTVAGNNYWDGNCQIAARFDAARLMADARVRVANSPEDSDAALRYGLLNLRLGERDEGLKYLENAYHLAQKPPVNSRVRGAAGRTLVSLQLDTADAAIKQKHYLDALVSINAAREFTLSPAEVSECFAREEQCLTAMNETGALIALYRDIYDKDPSFTVGQDPQLPARTHATLMLARMQGAQGVYPEAVAYYGELLYSTDPTSLQGRRFRKIVVTELAALLAKGGPNIYIEQQKQAADLLTKGDSDSLRKILQQYPLSSVADEAVMRVAKALDQAGESVRGAALLADALEELPTRKRRGEILGWQAIIYSHAGEAARARLTALKALREFPEGTLEIDGKRQSMRTLLAQLLQDENVGKCLPSLPSQLDLLWTTASDPDSLTRLPDQPQGGDQPQLLLGLAESRRGNHVQSVDPASGKINWSSPVLGFAQGGISVRGGTLLILMQGLMVVNGDGGMVWQEPTGGTPYTVDCRNGLVVYTTRSYDESSRRTLIHAAMRDVSNGSKVWEVQIDGNQAQWMQQVDESVVLMIQGDRTNELLSLDPETGATRERTTLQTQACWQSGAQPFVRDGIIHVLDTAGYVYRFNAQLEALKNFKVGEAQGTLFAPLGKDDLLVAGQRAVTRYDVKQEQLAWHYALKPAEIIVERHIVGDLLMLATRRGDGSNRIVGVQLSDGNEAFSTDVAPDEAGDVLTLRGAGAFSRGVAYLFLVIGKTDNGRGPRGAKLIVMGLEGKPTFEWFHEATSMPMQLAVIEGHVVVDYDNSVFCLGEKR